MGLLDWLHGRPSKDRFAQLAIRSFRELGDHRPIRYDPVEFVLILGEGSDTCHAYLHNIHAEYCAASRACRGEILRSYALSTALPPIPERWEEALPHLLPRVRERSYYGILRLQALTMEMEKIGIPYQLIGQHLTVSLAFDTPHSIMEVGVSNLSSWGKTLEEALQEAKEKLRIMSRQAFDSPADGVYVSPWKDNHDASRLFLDDLAHRLKVKGRPIAMVPNRDTLIVTGEDNPDGLALMAELTEEAMGRPRPMTGIPVRWEGDRWNTYRLPAGHPAQTRFDALWYSSLGRDYADQKGLLDKIHERRGEDLFVAPYLILTNKRSKQQCSGTTLTEGVPTLLPKADRIGFCRDIQGELEFIGIADWDKVYPLLMERMSPAETYPERYRVDHFPDLTRLKPLLDPA